MVSITRFCLLVVPAVVCWLLAMSVTVSCLLVGVSNEVLIVSVRHVLHIIMYLLLTRLELPVETSSIKDVDAKEHRAVLSLPWKLDHTTLRWGRDVDTLQGTRWNLQSTGQPPSSVSATPHNHTHTHTYRHTQTCTTACAHMLMHARTHTHTHNWTLLKTIYGHLPPRGQLLSTSQYLCVQCLFTPCPL